MNIGNSTSTIVILGILALFLVYGSLKLSNMPIKSLYKGYKALNQIDLVEFVEICEKYYDEKKYTQGIIHYYSIMGEVISASKGDFWHFSPYTQGESDQEAIERLHHIFMQYLEVNKNTKVLEIGCGYGNNLRWMAKNTGAQIYGLTLSPVEVEHIKAFREHDEIQNYDVIRGDYHSMSCFGDNSMDRVIGVYCLKYSQRLDKVFSEINRILKPGGRFLSYEIITTKKYQPNKLEHAKLVENICKSTLMPPLHNVKEYLQLAKKFGFEIVENLELSNNENTWYDYIQESGIYSMVTNKVINYLIPIAEKIRILKPGFAKFFKKLLVHPPKDFVKAGKMDIITGSRILVFRKS